MKTFIAMLTMSVGFVLFGQNVDSDAVMNDYTTQRVKLREAYINSIKKLNEVTIAKLSKATDDKSKAIVKDLLNWDSMDEISTKPENVNLGIPGVKDEQPKAVNKDIVYPEGTMLFNGKHYLLVKESKDYNQAMTECKKSGGHLIDINSKEIKEFFINKIAKTVPNNAIWVKAVNVKDDKDTVKLLGIKVSNDFIWITYKKNNFNQTYFDNQNYFVCEWDK